MRELREKAGMTPKLAQAADLTTSFVSTVVIPSNYMSEPPSPRVKKLFSRVEETTERLSGIVAEERELRDRLRELWEEITNLVATLADESSAAALANIGEVLRRQRKR